MSNGRVTLTRRYESGETSHKSGNRKAGGRLVWRWRGHAQCQPSGKTVFKRIIARMGGSDFLHERDGLSEQLLDAIGVAPSEIHEIAEAGNGADCGVHEGGVLGGGLLELGDGLREIVLEIFGVGGIVEAVDGAAPEGEAAPVAYAGGEFFVGVEGLEAGVQALEGEAVAFVIGPLDLRDELEYGLAGALGGSRECGSGGEGHGQQSQPTPRNAVRELPRR